MTNSGERLKSAGGHFSTDQLNAAWTGRLRDNSSSQNSANLLCYQIKCMRFTLLKAEVWAVKSVKVWERESVEASDQAEK